MSIQLEPTKQLSFRRPLTRMSTEMLIIRNPTDQDIAFKIKTTAPKSYCVRPNAGIVAPGGVQEVQVMLQPFKKEPPLDQICKDKFLVQTVILVNELKRLKLAEIWPHVETKAKALIQQTKLRCCYIDEDEKKRIVNATPVESVAPNFTASKFNATPVEPVAPNFTASKFEIMEPVEPVEPVESYSPAPSISTEQVTSSLSPVDEMAKMRNELDAYRNELDSLRARTIPVAAVESPASRSDNVSWPLVAVIALLSFLVSYILLKQSI